METKLPEATSRQASKLTRRLAVVIALVLDDAERQGLRRSAGILREAIESLGLISK